MFKTFARYLVFPEFAGATINTLNGILLGLMFCNGFY